MTYVYRVKNPGFDIELRKDIFKEGEPVLPPFTEVSPPSGAYLPWFNFEEGTWEEMADDKWIALVHKPEVTQESLLERLAQLLDEAEDIKQQLS